jgi:Ca2+-binding RTX toxin-like protein
MSKRAPMLLAAIAVMVALFATAAYAAEIHGTEKIDYLNESQRGDTITALAGNDEVYAGIYDELDTPRGDGDRDRVHGNKGNDYIDLVDEDGKDIAWGGKGREDQCFGDSTAVGNGGDKFFGCEYINGELQ